MVKKFVTFSLQDLDAVYRYDALASDVPCPFYDIKFRTARPYAKIQGLSFRYHHIHYRNHHRHLGKWLRIEAESTSGERSILQSTTKKIYTAAIISL